MFICSRQLAVPISRSTHHDDHHDNDDDDDEDKVHAVS